MDEKHVTYSDDNDDQNITGVTIAFAEEIEDERFYFRSFLPSKVGGKPAWLNARNIPKSTALKCQQCKKPLKFLLQLYAPVYKFRRSHHRIIYIFICSQHECCGKPGTIKVFRSQLAAQNTFYEDFEGKNNNSNSDNYDSETETQLEIKKKEDLLLTQLSKYTQLRIEPYPNIPNCIVCGIYGSFKCGACKNPLIYYCCKAHQKYHWLRQHRKYCKELKTMENEKELTECLKDYPFPTFEIVPDIEPLPMNDNVSELMRNYEKGDKNGTEYDENDLKLLEQQMVKDFDDFYLKFQERIERAPRQIIRYADGVDEEEEEEEDGKENENEHGWCSPLWMGKKGVIDCVNDVPKCRECGGDRTFEFQVMPQLLHILKQGVKDLDWGILAVFSCVNSCGDGEEKYFEEFIHYQPSYGAFENRDGDGLIG